MNCEKCKNRKATVFFADEGGGKHALCATCNATRLKILPGELSTVSDSENASAFFPVSSLSALTPLRPLSPFIKSGDRVCKGCGATEDTVSSLGHMLCPDCYDAFLDGLSSACGINDTEYVKKPYAIREKANKTRILADLRVRLRAAIEEESYEQAAALRDKIRAIEAKTK